MTWRDKNVAFSETGEGGGAVQKCEQKIQQFWGR